MIRIILVDDHAVARTGYRRRLDGELAAEIAGSMQLSHKTVLNRQ